MIFYLVSILHLSCSYLPSILLHLSCIYLVSISYLSCICLVAVLHISSLYLSCIYLVSPHFQLHFIDMYNSLLLLSFYWNTYYKMVGNTANVFLKKFFQLNHNNLLQVFYKCIVNYITYGGCITAKTIRILSAVSRHVII